MYNDDVSYGNDRGNRSRVSIGKRVAAGVAAGAAVMVPLATFLTTEKTPADKIALSYGGGPFEGNQYQRTVQPGSGLSFNGWADQWYEYPVTLRNYIVSSDKSEGDKETFDVIQTSDQNGVVENVELTLSFRLNTEIVRKFHEKIGLKYEAWDDDGWKKMLGDNIRQPLNNAVVKTLKGYSTDDIKTNPKVYEELEKAIEKELGVSLVNVLGDQYFCGPETEDGCGPIQVVVKSIAPNSPEVNTSYDDQKRSANGIQVAQNEAKAQIERAAGEKASKDAVAEALTPEYLAYLKAQALLKCAESSTSNCTIITTDGGGDLPALTVPIPSAQTVPAR